MKTTLLNDSDQKRELQLLRIVDAAASTIKPQPIPRHIKKLVRKTVKDLLIIHK